MTGSLGSPKRSRQAWPGSLVQTCVVHLIRASMRYVAYADRKAVAAALRPVYTAVDADAALAALVAFADSALGKKYPAAVATWENAWDRFIPFLDFGPATRKVIYTTNSIESLNYQLRKITQEPGPLPLRHGRRQSDVVGDPQPSRAMRARERAKQAGKPRAQRTAPGKLVEGFTARGSALSRN